MIRPSSAWLVLMASGLASCAPGLIGEDVPVDLPEQTIAGDPVVHAAALALAPDVRPVITVVSDQGAIDTSGLTQILLRTLTLDVTSTARPSGDSDCWDFVQSISVFIENTDQASTHPPALIAEGTMPGCVERIDLRVVAGVNLKPYTERPFRLRAEIRGVPPEDAVSFVAHLVLRAAVL